nr:hypothetical protein [Kibdelosporangium sp. MJ126-NF4]CTQ99009.1 hypothetical protein [Kibdelosporangium sp. MJ126-NF4]
MRAAAALSRILPTPGAVVPLTTLAILWPSRKGVDEAHDG